MQNDGMPSPWDRVAGLRPALASSVGVERHRYRGQTWYVLSDAQGRHFRCAESLYRVVARLDGQRSVGEIEAALQAVPGAEPTPAREDLTRLIAELHSLGMLDGPPPADQSGPSAATRTTLGSRGSTRILPMCSLVSRPMRLQLRPPSPVR